MFDWIIFFIFSVLLFSGENEGKDYEELEYDDQDEDEQSVINYDPINVTT